MLGGREYAHDAWVGAATGGEDVRGSRAVTYPVRCTLYAPSHRREMFSPSVNWISSLLWSTAPATSVHSTCCMQAERPKTNGVHQNRRLNEQMHDACFECTVAAQHPSQRVCQSSTRKKHASACMNEPPLFHAQGKPLLSHQVWQKGQLQPL